MSVLLDLAERCEKAEGPDRELDRELAAGLAKTLGWAPVEGSDDLWQRWNGGLCTISGLNFTASLDAALTLVPEGYRIASFGEEAYDDEPRPWVTALSARAGRFGAMGKMGRAATPALALCAAALRARAAQ